MRTTIVTAMYGNKAVLQQPWDSRTALVRRHRAIVLLFSPCSLSNIRYACDCRKTIVRHTYYAKIMSNATEKYFEAFEQTILRRVYDGYKIARWSYDCPTIFLDLSIFAVHLSCYRVTTNAKMALMAVTMSMVHLDKIVVCERHNYLTST